MWPGPQPNSISMNLCSCRFSHMIKLNKSTVASSWSAMVSRFCVRLTSKRIFENNPSDHEIWSIWSHARIHVDFTSILHSHTMLVPWASCEANLDRLRLFHQWECFKCNGHGLSVSCVKRPQVHVTTSLTQVPYNSIKPSHHGIPLYKITRS